MNAVSRADGNQQYRQTARYDCQRFPDKSHRTDCPYRTDKHRKQRQNRSFDIFKRKKQTQQHNCGNKRNQIAEIGIHKDFCMFGKHRISGNFI